MHESKQLSLIIPFYNQRETLPRLLDSILERAFPGLEVIVVDDCSDGGCADIVNPYRERGLPVTVIRHEKREYTKNARLTGITAAGGKYIGFADADDVLWGGGLSNRVQLMEKHGADVLHFNTVFVDDKYALKKQCHWTIPHARKLSGKEIFATFVRNNPNKGPSVWCRTFSRELCLKIVPFARETNVLRYGEDLLLTTLLLFHAQRYMGSDEVGYGYRWEPSKQERIPGRLATLYYLLTEVVPYLEEQGCGREEALLYRRYVSEAMRLWADKLCNWLLPDGTMHCDRHRLDSMLTHAECEEFIKIFVMCRQLRLRDERTTRKLESNRKRVF